MARRYHWLGFWNRSCALLVCTTVFALLLPVAMAMAVPPNDSFPGIAITGFGGARTGDANTGATMQFGEPAPTAAQSHAGASVWYSWTAPASGRITIDTFGSTFDTVLATYAGTNLASLTQRASNDDFSGARTSSVALTVAAGTTYYVQVSGFDGDTGGLALHWNFIANTYTLTPYAGSHGTISPGTAQTVAWGASRTFTITPDTGYHIVDVKQDGISLGALPSVAFTGVTSNHTLSATFAINTYTLTPYAGAHGTISPGTAQTVNYGSSKTFTITPDTGYHILDVQKAGVSIGASSSVTFTNVAASNSLSATFAIN